MNGHDTYNSLGLVATKKRKVLPGKHFDRLFPKPLNSDPILNKNGKVSDTIAFCEKIVMVTLNDTKAISKLLSKPTRMETCKAIFNFLYQHYQYKEDKAGVEQLRRPARAWKDRGNSYGGGVDCDCFTISISSILTNLKIPHYLRTVKMYHRDHYQHIYVVVPKCSTSNMSVRSNYIVIDPVLDKFDYESPDVTFKNDKKMGMPIQYLNGTGQGNAMPRLGCEFNGLGQGLGRTSGRGLYNDYMRRKKMHLINTRNAIARSPQRVSKVYKADRLLGMYDELIGAWDNEVQREFTLDKLSGIEEEALIDELQGLGSLIHGGEGEDLWDAVDELGEEEFEIDGLGKKSKAAKKAKKAAKKAARKVKRAGVFTKIKNAGKKVKAATKKVGGKVLKSVKKVAKAVVKFNPLTVAARASFLVAMKINFGRIASRAYYAYFSEAEANAAGVSSAYWRASKNLLAKMEKVFVQRLKGTSQNLKNAILKGRAKKKAPEFASAGKLKGLFGLGVVETATITAAMAFLTPILAFAKKAFSTFKKDQGGEEGEEELAEEEEEFSEELEESEEEISEEGLFDEEAPTSDPRTGLKTQKMRAGQSAVDNEAETEETEEVEEEDAEKSRRKPNIRTKEGMSTKKKLIIGGSIIGGVALIAVAVKFSGKKKAAPVAGLNGAKKSCTKKKCHTKKASKKRVTKVKLS